MGIRATGQKSLRATAPACFGTGTMVAVLKQLGTMAWAKERLQMLVKTSASCSAQALSTQPEMTSGPAALCAFTFTQGGTHITGGKCERQVVRCEHSFDGWFCFSTIKASINVVQFVREGGIAVLNLSSMCSL